MSTPTEALKPIPATYVKKSLCVCGYSTLNENVPLGTVYRIYPHTAAAYTMRCGNCRRLFPVVCVWCDPSEYGNGGFLPLGIFDTEAPA
jgi:hypothetical protein